MFVLWQLWLLNAGCMHLHVMVTDACAAESGLTTWGGLDFVDLRALGDQCNLLQDELSDAVAASYLEILV